jgi:hypothetical protein
VSAVLANVLWPLGAAALLASVAAGRTGHRREWRLLAGAGTAMFAAGCAVEGAWLGAAWNALLAVVLLGWDWWNRKGRRVAKQLSEEARALVAGLAEKLRETLEPAPEGVPT